MQESELILAIRSIRDEWQVEENIRVASEKLREKEMERVKAEVKEAEAEASKSMDEARMQSQKILDDARNQARNFIKEKEREIAEQRQALEKEYQQKLSELESRTAVLEEGKSEAEAKSRELGYEAGYQEGMARFQKMVDSLAEVLAGIEAQSDRIYQEQLPGILLFVKTFIEKVVGALSDNLIEVVLNNLDKGLKELSRAKKLKVIVSEQDYDTLMVMEAEFRKHFAATTQVELLKDASIQPGGCLIESELGSVDATIETQMALLNQELRHD